MADPPLRPDPWATHEREQSERWQKLTYAQRLDWLWQAKQFALRARGLARSSAPPGAIEDGGASAVGPVLPRRDLESAAVESVASTVVGKRQNND